MIVDASNYRWRSRPFRLWLYDHGVTLDNVFRIDIDEFTQVITVYEFVRSGEGLPLTDYATMGAAANIREIKMLRRPPSSLPSLAQPCFFRPQRLFTVEQHVILHSVGKMGRSCYSPGTGEGEPKRFDRSDIPPCPCP